MLPTLINTTAAVFSIDSSSVVMSVYVGFLISIIGGGVFSDVTGRIFAKAVMGKCVARGFAFSSLRLINIIVSS